ncbi:xanthine dehydrogenase/oxidase-like [Haliotis rufescens]|uniref:xanthine dehydrogenase/oxidase-like n=1 Tax=Haliotis rufescens TaxID=6454 RepID=UPI00201F52B5|nr:xanthine dehydrogenase/oxidase-like [Haliotis rufescens]
MESTLVLFVNGIKVTEPRPDPRGNLLQYLRRRLRLTGSKEGCGEGRCGACTVMLSRYDRREKTIRHMAVNACLLPLCSLHNMAVTTVEGVGDTRRGLHKIQECLAEAHGVQCGFCTSGMVMSMYTLLRNIPRPSQEDIQLAIEGNLCRCTGYRSIIDGFTKAAQARCCQGDEVTCACRSNDTEDYQKAPDDKHTFCSREPTQDVIFPPQLMLGEDNEQSLTFEHEGTTWIRPPNLHALLQCLAENPTARLIAGGTTIFLDLKLKHKLPQTLVSTSHIPELTRLTVEDDHLVVGAGITLEELRTRLPGLVSHLPGWRTRSVKVLGDALRWVAAGQVRNVASVGGNLLNPATVSDLQPVFLAMDAMLHIDNANSGERTIPYRDAVMTSPPQQCLAPGDVLVYTSFPFTRQDDHMMFFKQPERQGFDTAVVNTVPKITFKPGRNIIEELHFTFGGKCFQPIVKTQNCMQHVVGKIWSLSLVPTVLASLENLLDKSAITDDARHVAMAQAFKFMFAVEETLTGQTVRNAPSALSTVDYESTRVFDNVGPVQLPEDDMRRPIPHSSALQITCGEAVYLDDMPRCEDELFAGLVLSTKPHARVVNVETTEALALPGVTGYVDHQDVPGKNLWGCFVEEEEVFAETKVNCCGQIIGLVLAIDRQVALEAARCVKVQYEDLPAVLTIEDAIREKAFYTEEPATPAIVFGDVEAGFAASDVVIEGHVDIDPREHFYMESQGVLVKPRAEHNEVDVYCTSQNPSGTQGNVARVLGIPLNRVVCHVKRIGGGFGGKISRVDLLSQPVAVAAYKYRRPVRCVLDRRTDMAITGKAPRFHTEYKIGYTKDGRIQSVVMDMYVDGGHHADVTYNVLQQCVLSFEAAYRYPNCRITGYLCKTNTPPNTAFRGFGAPDSFLVSEMIMTELASRLNMTETQVREMNMLREGDVTVSDMLLDNCTLSRCWRQCLEESQYEVRKTKVQEFNRHNEWKKRGIAVVPYRFGIGYKERFMCKAGALVHVYVDGSVLLTHGGTEMGQGLYIKMIQVASHVLGVPASNIHTAETSTDTVPNTVPTAASVSSDQNGKAVKAACEEIVRRLESIKNNNPDKTWTDWVMEAYMTNVNLSAVGHYGSSELNGFDFNTLKGKLYDYTTCGAGCSEVEVDCLTGECQILQTDMVIDVGRSLNPGIDIGQIEGAFQQGCGHMLLERAVVSEDGWVLQGGPAEYKIPTVRNIPRKLNVSLLKDSANPHGIFSSRGIGEPPMCTAMSVYFALKAAILDCRVSNGCSGHFDMHVPATAERIREACRACIFKLTDSKH